jgi:hypothetical protein
MRIMRPVSLMLVLSLALGAWARAQDASARDQREQMAAATSRALESLRAQVAAEPIGPGLTVQDLLDKTRSTKTLMQTLRRAQQIGGPRWLDPQTCQVRLEIGGPMVANALYNIAAHDNRTPIAPDALQARLLSWNKRTFSATGTSTGAAAVEQALADKVHRQAVCDARRDAVNQVLQSIRPIPLNKGKTVADALALPGVRDEIEKWLNDRPVTQVEFRDVQQQARVTLAVAGDELFDTFRAAVAKQADALGPMDEPSWSRVRDEFIARVGPAAGRAMAMQNPPANAAAPPPVAIPSAAPDWVDRQLEASGVGGGGAGSRLKAARAAEADAADKLRAMIEPLVLSPGLTLRDAAQQDKQIALAIDRALIRGTRTTRVDYPPDGGAKVVVTLDLRDLWQEIASAP